MRPEADHRRLPYDAALAKLGMWSDKKKSLVAVAVIVLVCLAMMAVAAARAKSHHPRSTIRTTGLRSAELPLVTVRYWA